MKTPRIVSLLAALSFTTAAFAEGPGPGGEQPPGPPPSPRGNEGPHGRAEQGPAPRREHDFRRGPQQGAGDSAEKREHIEEALKHLRAAGLGHMAERIQQSLKNNPQGAGPQAQQHRQDFRRGPRNHDRRREGPWQSNAGPRQFRHPHLPNGPGFGTGRGGQPGPFARPNFQARGERRHPGFAPQQQPKQQGSGDNDLRNEVQQLKRAVEELRRSLNTRGDRDGRADGPGPDRQRRPEFDRKDEPRREQSRDNDRRDDGPRGDDRRPEGPRADGPRHEGPRQDGPRGDSPRREGPGPDGPRQDGPRNDGPPGERL